MRVLQRGFGIVTVVLAIVIVVGCSKTKTKTKTGKTPPPGKQVHKHPDAGPHGGALIELGEEEYHGEFTVDHKTKKVTVYILDGEAKKAHAIKAKTIKLTVKKEDDGKEEIELKADPDKKDAAGTSSRFTGMHEMFAKERNFEGRIDLMIGGKAYGGDFKEK